jgi:NAD(P)-dependent dehydrogenase (short-subunit alcohol dehydrogenase family)
MSHENGATMAGKVAIVTGAAGGIGSVTARVLAAAGARLVLVDSDEVALTKVASSIGGGVRACPADVTDSAAVAAYVRVAVDEFGRLDVLFNNAGIEGEVATIAEADEATFDRVMAINVKGLWLNMKHAIRAMREAGNGGCIINNSSGLGHTGLPTLGAYVGSKHAVIGLTRTAALEVGPEGIRVNAICPGPVETRMMTSLEEQGIPDDPASARELYTRAVPLGRYGRPEEVAELVLFLASERSSFINGAALAIDGGSTAD